MLNCNYYFCVYYKKDLDFCSKSKADNKLASELKKLMILNQENLHHTQKL